MAREALRYEEAEEPTPFFAEAPPLPAEPAKQTPKAEAASEEDKPEAKDEAEPEYEDDVVPHVANRPSDRRHRAPEANQLHGEQAARERIGHVLIAAEATHEAKQAPERLQLPPDKRVETLPRAELLSFSAQITVEGSTLRDVYETHLIGEQALRRLVAEYLHGGDLQKALLREIVEHEIDFERDPALRDMAVPTDADTNDTQKLAAPGKETLNELLQKAGAVIGGSDEDETVSYGKPKTTASPAEQPYPRQQPVDVIMGVIIVVLIILVVSLYFWHH
jgi:hypothetical protein